MKASIAQWQSVGLVNQRSWVQSSLEANLYNKIRNFQKLFSPTYIPCLHPTFPPWLHPSFADATPHFRPNRAMMTGFWYLYWIITAFTAINLIPTPANIGVLRSTWNGVGKSPSRISKLKAWKNTSWFPKYFVRDNVKSISTSCVYNVLSNSIPIQNPLGN